MNTISSLFSPPEAKFGAKLLICGMTADAVVLNNIVETFTGEVAATHSMTGRIVGMLMLDASQPQFAPGDVPGLLHLPKPNLKSWSNRTSLLHAKVALLGFSDVRGGDVTHFRLIVSTGNWTTASFGLGGQIDIIWCTETKVSTAGVDRNDCAAAMMFFERLIAEVFQIATTQLPWSLAEWISSMKGPLPSNIKERRFIHSLTTALLPQISDAFQKFSYGTVLCGSGFFEQTSNDAGHQPTVFENLDNGLARGKKNRVVVNRDRAGALAKWFNADEGSAKKWAAHKPRDPIARMNGRQDLHAKYIAALRGGDEQGYTIAQLYIGSGNLSKMGLLSHANLAGANRTSGNIEAGVVFRPVDQPSQVWSLLAPQLACGVEYGKKELSQFKVGETDDSFPLEDGPPLLWFTRSADVLVPTFSQTVMQADCALDNTWIPVSESTRLAVPADAYLTVIRVRRDSQSPVFLVPIFSETGGFCRSKPPALTAESALQSILDFPSVQPTEDDPDDDRKEIKQKGSAPIQRGDSAYPVKWISTILESIARRHETLDPAQYPVWFSHLRMVLCEQVREEERLDVRALSVNPFPVLLREGFKPSQMSDESTTEYRSLIDDIGQAWFPDKSVPVLGGDV